MHKLLLDAIADKLELLTFLDLDWAVVNRVLEREKSQRRSGPIAEGILRHPFFKLSAVSFDSHKMQWQLKTFESQRENKYDYGDNLAELLGTLLAEHLEKENNGKTSKGD